MCVCTTFSLCIGHLGCLHILTLVINAAINMRVQVSFRDPNFNYFGFILRRRIAGAYDSSIFKFLRMKIWGRLLFYWLYEVVLEYFLLGPSSLILLYLTETFDNSGIIFWLLFICLGDFLEVQRIILGDDFNCIFFSPYWSQLFVP